MKGALLNNIKTFLNSAELVYNSGDYTSATILYFKCFFAIADYILLTKTGRTPKDHTERFNLLMENIPKLYIVLDKQFPTYRNTYSLSVDKEKCEEIRKDVNQIIKEYKIPVTNK